MIFSVVSLHFIYDEDERTNGLEEEKFEVIVCLELVIFYWKGLFQFYAILYMLNAPYTVGHIVYTIFYSDITNSIHLCRYAFKSTNNIMGSKA
jgi:hypothetical protein